MRRNVVYILLALFMLTLGMTITADAGWIKNEDGSKSYTSESGTLLQNKRKKIGKYWYYFDAEGMMVRKAWVGKRYYRKNGRMAVSTFVDDRYVGRNGIYVKGLKKIEGNTYYFDPQTGKMLTGQQVAVDGKTYILGEDGVCTKVKTKKTKAGKATVPVESTYYSDPDASDEELLAAIIFCEAGNQPYDGQLAVGLVITNRVRSSLFPNTIRQVIYATDQFSPARNGYLTGALKGSLRVSATAKKAAAQVLSMYAANSYKITNAAGKQVSMKNYLFFMTASAYQSLGLRSRSRVLWDHVFFKTWA